MNVGDGKGRLQHACEKLLAKPAQPEARQRDAELSGREIGVQMIADVPRESSPQVPLLRQSVQLTAAHFDQTELGRDTLGDSVEYLIPNLKIRVEFYDGKAVGIELPQTVELTVIETEPGLKSATASSVTKPAKTETGLVVQVPPFINEGEKIRVDTAEGAYLSRA